MQGETTSDSIKTECVPQTQAHPHHHTSALFDHEHHPYHHAMSICFMKQSKRRLALILELRLCLLRALARCGRRIRLWRLPLWD